MELDGQFQAYGWAHNKGYGASAHLDALRTWAPTTTIDGVGTCPSARPRTALIEVVVGLASTR